MILDKEDVVAGISFFCLFTVCSGHLPRKIDESELLYMFGEWMPHFFTLGWDPKAQEAEYVGYLFPQPSLAPRVKYVTLTLPIKAPDLDSGTRTQESKGLGSSHSHSLAMSIVAKTISSNSWCRNSCTANCHFWWSEGVRAATFSWFCHETLWAKQYPFF